MNLQDLDLIKITKLITQATEDITCLECCKYYIAPATAGCGHTLCHTCWRGRRTCPTCGAQLDRKILKLNLPLQTLTNNVRGLSDTFEKLFNIKLDEFNLDTPGALEVEPDPNKNVKDWLTSSQNHFSAAIQNSESFSQEVELVNPLEISASNIIVHTDTKKIASPPKIVHVPPPQDDWDKIETMPDSEETKNKKANIVGPMDIEPFFVDDSEYTMDNPRRSSRKRELKNDESMARTHELSSNKHSSRDSSGENDKKSQKVKQTWNNVKRMRKEFSKLNKKNRSKLNVSIEMVKKTQPKPNIDTPVLAEQIYTIDDNTPNEINKENKNENKTEVEPLGNTKPVLNSSKLDAGTHLKEHQYDNNNDLPKNIQNINNIQIPNDAVIQNANDKIPKNILASKATEDLDMTHDCVPLTRMPFIKKSSLNPNKTDIVFSNIPQFCTEQPVISDNSDDIEISIRVGNTITNIVIKKKQKDVQVKINTDREVQTSIGPHHLDENEKATSNNINKHRVDVTVENNTKDQELNFNKNTQVNSNIEKSSSGKKNTASADTATAQFEITESVEKELSKIMEGKEPVAESPDHSMKKPQTIVQKPDEIVEDFENIDDIFNSGSVKEANVRLLKEHAPSEILISTVQSKLRTQRHPDKRERDIDDEELLPQNKKTKTNQPELKDKPGENTDSEPINYDAFMGQVFASIDADIEDIRKSQDVESETILKNTENVKSNKEVALSLKTPTEIQNTQVIKKLASQRVIDDNTPKSKEYFEKHSENVFSILEKDDESYITSKTGKVQQQENEILTPVHNLESSQESIGSLDKVNKPNRKTQECDDDKSVVEETPQKSVSFSKLKRASTANQSQLNDSKKVPIRKSTSNINSIINLADTVTESNKSTKDVTVINTEAQKQALETPLTITKFADQVKHKSTPIARKSLNFDNENDDNDPEQTLCPTSEAVAKTTQEKEFMSKAFESTPTTPAVRPLLSRNVGSNSNRKLCLAASCLTPSEIAKVKTLCNARKWSYVDKYTKDITHLIVGVDEDRRSQRSVKYMCALAASKWIVSYEWVLKCLQTKDIANEECFEALDSTGEPGPRRSRIAKRKLFEGITFYCMPPFSVLDVDTLQKMLRAAGGRVVNEARLVRISIENCQPALLLAEPEHTQEDRFIYLAMEMCIVPVNYEWVLNCLGSYTLSSIHELLLCPSSLLPAVTERWPEVLIDQDYD